MAAILNVPAHAQEKKQNPVIICVHPGSSCKDQAAGIYAEKLAELGYVTEYPAARVEGIRCAVDFLTTLEYVDENRIGVLGVCAGGGYAVKAAMTERRIKAIGTVVGANIGQVNREGDPIKVLEAIAAQRTAEARGAKSMIKDLFVIEGASHYDLYDKPEL